MTTHETKKEDLFKIQIGEEGRIGKGYKNMMTWEATPLMAHFGVNSQDKTVHREEGKTWE